MRPPRHVGPVVSERRAAVRRLAVAMSVALARARHEIVRGGARLVDVCRRGARVLGRQVGRAAQWTTALVWGLLLALLVCAWLLKLALAPRIAAVAGRLGAWRTSPIRGLCAHVSRWGGRLVGAARWLRVAAVARGRRGVRSPWPGAESDDFEIGQEDLDAGDEEGALAHQAPGPLPGWAIRLPAHTRAWRGLLLAATVGAALFVVLGGPGSLLADVQGWTASLTLPRTVAAMPQLNASFWVAHRVPYQALDARGIILAPSAATSTLAYACWVDDRSFQAGVPAVNLYVTSDGARSWQALTVPHNQAGACQPVADAADPAQLLLVLTPTTADDCGTPSVYASGDQGADWLPVALPPTLAGACDPTFYFSRGLIYAWSPAAQAQGNGGPAAQLVISDDDGQSWRPVFDSAPAEATVALVAARANGALLVLVSAPAARSASAPARALWCRATAGATWLHIATLPASTSIAYAATGQPSGTGCSWGALYAAGVSAGDNPAITRLEVSSGHGWKMMPSLPVAGSAANSPLTIDGNVLSVAPDDTLLVDIPYDSPSDGVTAGATTPGHTFWGWDPHTNRWLEDMHASPANSSIDGFVWDYGENGVPRLICWVFTLNSGVPAFTGLYRAAFAAPSAPSQDAGDQRAPGL